jgi:hypothetical protein
MDRRSSARTAGRRGAEGVTRPSHALATTLAFAAVAAVSLLAPGQSWAQG